MKLKSTIHKNNNKSKNTHLSIENKTKVRFNNLKFIICINA